ncbi:hypothetical protein C2E23DRAFT_135308 [Lenzites betulinus]|nr:hypothetical protein C2E23DRAFT_135308 [Lenzites betulinus]
MRSRRAGPRKRWHPTPFSLYIRFQSSLYIDGSKQQRKSPWRKNQTQRQFTCIPDARFRHSHAPLLHRNHTCKEAISDYDIHRARKLSPWFVQVAASRDLRLRVSPALKPEGNAQVSESVELKHNTPRAHDAFNRAIDVVVSTPLKPCNPIMATVPRPPRSLADLACAGYSILLARDLSIPRSGHRNRSGHQARSELVVALLPSRIDVRAASLYIEVSRRRASSSYDSHSNSRLRTWTSAGVRRTSPISAFLRSPCAAQPPSCSMIGRAWPWSLRGFSSLICLGKGFSADHMCVRAS